MNTEKPLTPYDVDYEAVNPANVDEYVPDDVDQVPYPESSVDLLEKWKTLLDMSNDEFHRKIWTGD